MSKSSCDGSQGKDNSLFEEKTTLKTARGFIKQLLTITYNFVRCSFDLASSEIREPTALKFNFNKILAR